MKSSASRIRVTCEGAGQANYDDLIPFQGELKSLSSENYKKLKKEILDLGFSEPISVWKDQGKMFILNGHQRHRVVKTMVEQEGFSCPQLPVNFIEAETMNEAKRKVLALTSNYGKIEDQGLYLFMQEAQIPFDELRESYVFPEINFDSFGQEYYDVTPDSDGKKKDGGKELSEDDFQNFEHTCPKCGFGFNAT